MAKYLESSLLGIPQVVVSRAVQTNAVFAILPADISSKLRERHYFYVWDEDLNEVRWMCSFNTKTEDIDLFIKDLKNLVLK